MDLKDNLLTSFPEDIKGATIEYLNIANNRLETFPLGICSITTLKNLDISENKDIRELPIELGYLSKLVDFNFKGLIVSIVVNVSLSEKAKDCVNKGNTYVAKFLKVVFTDRIL